jgi:hypothetical protein
MIAPNVEFFTANPWNPPLEYRSILSPEDWANPRGLEREPVPMPTCALKVQGTSERAYSELGSKLR